MPERSAWDMARPLAPRERWQDVTDLGGPGRVPLTPEERDTVLTMYQTGRKFDEIAISVGRCVGTVKTAVYYARERGLVGRRNRQLRVMA